MMWLITIVIVLYLVIANVNKISISIFGRRRSLLAKLIEPPELAVEPYPDSANDYVVKKLAALYVIPSNILMSKWQPLWLDENTGVSTASIEDIEKLFHPMAACNLPYELIDHPPIILKNGADIVDMGPPSEPPTVPETYPSPVMSLPYWSNKLLDHFFHKHVEAAHKDLIARYRSLLYKQSALEESAININTARRKAWLGAMERYHKAKIFFREREAAKADIERLRQGKSLITEGDAAGVIQHFDLVLRRLQLPAFIPRQWSLQFQTETKTLLLEYRFPETARLEVVKLVQQTRGSVIKPASQTIRKTLIPKIQPALCLQLARAMADSDTFDLLDAIAVNGWVDFFDRATGLPKRSYCASLIAKKEALLALNLKNADMVAAFNALRGANAGASYETAPVMPSLRMQTDDPRFIESRQTIEKMAKGENLAAMDWEDFEHLVRELFQREFAAVGAEVRITRASRDQGVDAIIFDPDPLRGGKIVIQAKRYTIPVDVSAVRDLYGTVHNEGANTGILVTTSHYGPEAYEFAQNKPLKLINGAQLLGLLERAGYHFRIDLNEARALAAKQNNKS